VCDIFGIDTQAQTDRIKDHPALRRGLALIEFPLPYGNKGTRMEQMLAISLTRFHAWLSSISIERLSVDDEAKKHLIEFQDVAADVMFGYFGRRLIPEDIRVESEGKQTPNEQVFYDGLAAAHEAKEAVTALTDRVAG